MVFHRKQKQIEPLHFSIDGKVIEKVSSFNFLGITLDEGLTWKNHIDLIKNSTIVILNCHNSLAKSTKLLLFHTDISNTTCILYMVMYVSNHRLSMH